MKENLIDTRPIDKHSIFYDISSFCPQAGQALHFWLGPKTKQKAQENLMLPRLKLSRTSLNFHACPPIRLIVNSITDLH